MMFRVHRLTGEGTGAVEGFLRKISRELPQVRGRTMAVKGVLKPYHMHFL